MNINQLSMDDLRQYFQNSVVNVPGERGVFYIIDVHRQDDGTPYFRGWMHKTPTTQWSGDKVRVDAEDISLVLPQPKSVQMGNVAGYVYRVPRRQWSRGLTNNNFMGQLIDEKVLTQFPHLTSKVEDDRVFSRDNPLFYYRAFYPDYASSLAEAAKEVESRKYMHRCVCKDFTVGVSHKVKHLCLFYKTYPVGEVDERGGFSFFDGFKKLQPIFQQQLTQGVII